MPCAAGAEVTVLEPHALASGTTGKTFSWPNATSKTENEAYHRLNAAGVTVWIALARESGENAIGLHPTGVIACWSPSVTNVFSIPARPFMAIKNHHASR
jgi:glycine/D-amino acid oxidase-like deaminating enzyme